MRVGGGGTTKPAPKPSPLTGSIGGAATGARGAKAPQSGMDKLISTMKKAASRPKTTAKKDSAETARIKAFQRAHHLTPDGIVGPKTRAAGWGKSSSHSTSSSSRSSSSSSSSSSKSSSSKSTGYKAVDPKTIAKNAAAAVSAELNGQENAIQRQIDLAQRQAARDGGQITARGLQAQKDLKGLYAQLNTVQNQLRTSQQQMYGKAKQDSASQYAALTSNIAGNGQAAVGSTNDELARMGLGAVGAAATAGTRRDTNYLQGLASVNGANAQSNLDNTAQSWAGLLNAQQSAGQQQGARSEWENTSHMNDLLAALQASTSDKVYNLSGQKNDIEATRAEKMRQLIEAMSDKEYNRTQESQQTQFEQQMARDKFGLEKSAYTASMQPRQPTQMEVLQAANIQSQIDARERAARAAQLAAQAKLKDPYGLANIGVGASIPGMYAG